MLAILFAYDAQRLVLYVHMCLCVELNRRTLVSMSHTNSQAIWHVVPTNLSPCQNLYMPCSGDCLFAAAVVLENTDMWAADHCIDCEMLTTVCDCEMLCRYDRAKLTVQRVNVLTQ